jgi:hypothetical protein
MAGHVAVGTALKASKRFPSTPISASPWPVQSCGYPRHGTRNLDTRRVGGLAVARFVRPANSPGRLARHYRSPLLRDKARLRLQYAAS